MAKALETLQMEVEVLKKRIDALEGHELHDTKDSKHKCDPVKPLTIVKYDANWTPRTIIVGWACKCGKHMGCGHLCESYQCLNSVMCGVEFCEKCIQQQTKQKELDAKKKKCIRCHFGGAPALAAFGGNFCSSHCEMMCALYDK